MAKLNTFTGLSATFDKPAIKRKGVHSKRGKSKSPSSKNYKKAYRGQG